MASELCPLLLYRMQWDELVSLTWEADCMVMCYFFTEKKADSAVAFRTKMQEQLNSYAACPLKIFIVYTGKSRDVPEIEPLKRGEDRDLVFWAGEDAEVCKKFDITEDTAFFVFRGPMFEYREETFPEDLRARLQTPCICTFPSYLSFVTYLNNNSPRTPAHYSHDLLTQTNAGLNSTGAVRLLQNLTDLYGLDFLCFAPAFQEQYSKYDRERIDTYCISQPDFIRRLKALCIQKNREVLHAQYCGKDGKVTIARFFDTEKCSVDLPCDSITFCYFFTKDQVEEAESVQEKVKKQLEDYCEYETNVFVVYVGEDAEELETMNKGRLWRMTQSDLESEDWKRFGCNVPGFLVLKGVEVLYSDYTPPCDLTAFLPPSDTFNYPGQLQKILEFLESVNNRPLRGGYKTIKRISPNMGKGAMYDIGYSLFRMFGYDFRCISDWFLTESHPLDAGNVIQDISDIQVGEFERRLLSFIRYSVKQCSEFTISVQRLTDASRVEFTVGAGARSMIYFFSDAELDTAQEFALRAGKQLQFYCTYDIPVIAVYCGKTNQKRTLEGLKQEKYARWVYWIGQKGEKAQLCSDCGVTQLPTFVVMEGAAVNASVLCVPEDFPQYLPCQPCYNYFSFYSLASYLQQNPNNPVVFGYRNLSKSFNPMTLDAITIHIANLSREFAFDLTELIQWFRYPKYMEKIIEGVWISEDEVTVGNITEEQFSVRLSAFLDWKCSHMGDPPCLKEIRDITETVGSRLKGAFSSSNSLKAQLQAEKDMVEQLKRELSERNAELSRLKETQSMPTVTKALTSQSAEPQKSVIPKSLSHPESLRETDADFWKQEDEEWDDGSKPPQKFEEIAASKGLWIVTAESKGLAPANVGVETRDRRRPLPRSHKKGSLPPLLDPPRPR